ncbi:MAG: hypothetical protein IKR39_02280 [Lachnospiraceae bacterium]|nr:hypothetical protein [Lachnospiraceae bacterium]
MKDKSSTNIVVIALIVAAVAVAAFFFGYVRAHSYTLSGTEALKSEQIQPIFATVKVTGTEDTDVVFTDVETGKEYKIGYITPGMGGSIKLERGKWYRVEGGGKLTVWPVRLRVE